MSVKEKVKGLLPTADMLSAVVLNGLKKPVGVPDFPYQWKTANRQMLDKEVVAISYRKGEASSVPTLIYGDTLFQLVSLVKVKESTPFENNGQLGSAHTAEVLALLMMPESLPYTDDVNVLLDKAEQVYTSDMFQDFPQFTIDKAQRETLVKLMAVAKTSLIGASNYQEQMNIFFGKEKNLPELMLHVGGLVFTDENGKDESVIGITSYINLLQSLNCLIGNHNETLYHMAASSLIVALQQGFTRLNINVEDGSAIVTEAQKKQMLEQVENLKKRHEATGRELSNAILRLHDANDNIPEQVKKEMARRLGSSQSTSDEGKTGAWLNAVLGLPFGKYAEPDFSLDSVAKGMDLTHFGMEKAKEKVLSFVARSIRQQQTGESGAEPAILCFVGAPGIGKTTLAKSLANALGLPSEIISLAGAHDAHILRGHSFTYVGSEMGKIGRALSNMGVMNGVLILDEIDKTNKGGAKASSIDDALLALLDPSQNNNFHDDYLGFGLDVSKCLIICTANYMDQIPEALESRMSIIKLNSYSMPQKTHIGQKYLLPDVLHGVKGKDGFSVEITDDAWQALSSEYTFEAGVRKLRECVVDIVNKSLITMMRDDSKKQFVVNKESLKEHLGKPKIIVDKVPENTQSRSGVINGLSVMGYVGGILSFNAMLRPMFNNSDKVSLGKLILTGRQKDMMKESFDDAFSVALDLFNQEISENGNKEEKLRRLYNHDIHLSTDETATPKDGNSAGGVVTVLLYALLANKPIRSDVAMTGAINLQGQIKAIGGLREKLLGAAEAGVKLALYPVENQADYEDIDPSDLEYIAKTGMKVQAISTIQEAVEAFVTE